MTEYYNREEMFRYCIYFHKDPESVRPLYYFDFDTKRWRLVKPIDYLRYNLCTYFYIDEEFGDVIYDDNCIVTCTDSYRLSENPALEPSINEMFAEKEWRDKIVKGSEFDYRTEEICFRAAAIEVKHEIIPGMILGSDRLYHEYLGFTLYKESKIIGKSGTFLPVMTDKDKQRQIEENNEYQLFIKNKISEMKKIIPIYTHRDHVQKQFRDIRHYYRTLKIYPEPITFALLRKKINIDPIEKKSTMCFAALLSIASDYDACFYEKQINVEDGAWTIPHNQGAFFGDFVFDFVVHDSTYAKLCFRGHIVGTLDNITIDNPLLFGSTRRSDFKIITDGTKIKFKVGFFQNSPIDVINELCGNWCMNHVQENVLVTGPFGPHLMFPADELVAVQSPN